MDADGFGGHVGAEEVEGEGVAAVAVGVGCDDAEADEGVAEEHAGDEEDEDE